LCRLVWNLSGCVPDTSAPQLGARHLCSSQPAPGTDPEWRTVSLPGTFSRLSFVTQTDSGTDPDCDERGSGWGDCCDGNGYANCVDWSGTEAVGCLTPLLRRWVPDTSAPPTGPGDRPRVANRFVAWHLFFPLVRHPNGLRDRHRLRRVRGGLGLLLRRQQLWGLY
jgi:hypothetical protein